MLHFPKVSIHCRHSYERPFLEIADSSDSGTKVYFIEAVGLNIVKIGLA